MLKGTGKAIRQARSLRRQMSLPELLLWRQLRKRESGYHWREQHPAGPYSLDFYCDLATLCVEVDGEAHERGDRPQRDQRRDAWIAAEGILTLRIPAAEVLGNMEGVIAFIHAHARERAPLHQVAAGPPPPARLGEDFPSVQNL
jgi:very-short-patch-repair endonuclease